MSEYVVSVNGREIKVILSGDSQNILADTSSYVYDIVHLIDKKYLLKLNNKFIEITSGKINGGNLSVIIQGVEFETVVKSALSEKASALLRQRTAVKSKTEIKAPMPGMILKIKRNLNDKVSQGDTVIILEAMKMENDLRAPHSGVIKEIFVNEGSAIEKGTVLFTIE